MSSEEHMYVYLCRHICNYVCLPKGSYTYTVTFKPPFNRYNNKLTVHVRVYTIAKI